MWLIFMDISAAHGGLSFVEMEARRGGCRSRSDRPADLADEAVALTCLVPLREWWPGPSMALFPASELGTLGKPIQVGRDAVDVSENVGRSDRAMQQAEAT
jgi:hypothetical protein